MGIYEKVLAVLPVLLLFEIKQYHVRAVHYINDTSQNTHLNYDLFYYPKSHFHTQSNLIFCVGERIFSA